MPKCENCSKWRCICEKLKSTDKMKKMTLAERVEILDIDNIPSPKKRKKKINPSKKTRHKSPIFHGYCKTDPKKKITTPFNNFEDLYDLPVERLQNLRANKRFDYTLLHIASRFFGQTEIDFCIETLGFDINVISFIGETPLFLTAKHWKPYNFEYLQSLGAENSPEIEEKLSLWEAYGDALECIQGIWKPSGQGGRRTSICFGNRFHVVGRQISVYKKSKKMINIPIGIYQDNQNIYFSWKGHTWAMKTILDAENDLISDENLSKKVFVWKRVESDLTPPICKTNFTQTWRRRDQTEI